LEMSLGLRVGFAATPTEVNALNTVPYDCDCNNFAPTVGVAYRLPGPYGVARAAFGIHYGSLLPVTYQQLRYNAPGNVKLVLQQPDLADPLAGFDVANPGKIRGVRYALDPELASPYSMQYNFSWELEPLQDWYLSFGYVGSRSPKLLMQWYLNRGRLVDGIPSTISTVSRRRLDQTISEERLILNSSRGYYDAAKVELRIPHRHGLGLDGAYWFSKHMDLGADYTNTAAGNDGWRTRSQTEQNIHSDMKARSRFDQPHAALLRLTYETPALSGGGGTLSSESLGAGRYRRWRCLNRERRLMSKSARTRPAMATSTARLGIARCYWTRRSWAARSVIPTRLKSCYRNRRSGSSSRAAQGA